MMTGRSHCQQIISHVVDLIGSDKGVTGKTMKFMEDNATINTGAVARIYLSDEAIRTIIWPPHSLDFNPVKTV